MCCRHCSTCASPALYPFIRKSLIPLYPDNVLQALQYLRKLCSHPLLVLDRGVPEHVAAVEAQLGPWPAAQAALRDLSHAPKLQALKQLLSECGIGVEPGVLV